VLSLLLIEVLRSLASSAALSLSRISCATDVPPTQTEALRRRLPLVLAAGTAVA
jgi:hypothetical protein